MEHPCYRCGAMVEDGTAFCANCNAPQIRVGGLETGLPIEAEGSLAPHATIVIDPTKIQWSQALPAASFAGLISAFLMFVPFGAFGLGMIAAGTLAVLFYRRRRPESNLTPGMGAQLGAVSGALAFAIFSVFTSIGVLVFHSGNQLRSALLDAVQQSAARNPDPQAQQVLEYLKSPAGLAVVMTLGLAVMFILFLIFASVSGAITAGMLRRKNPY